MHKTNYKQTEIGEIPEEWRVVPLEKLIDIKHGFAYKGKYFSTQITNDVLLTPGNVAIGGGFQGEKYKYYSGEVPSDYVFSAGDIFVNMTDLSKTGDTLGYSAKVPQVDGKRFLHNQRLGLVEFVSNDTDKEFIYWKLRDPFYRSNVLGSATGTTVKHTSPGRIKSIQITLPAKNEQQQIASMLSSLDDKIELNRRMNKILEDMGKTLFKRWFVNFEFPNENGKPYKSSGGEMVNSELGEIPRESEIKELDSISEIKNGFAFKSEDYTTKGVFLLRTRNFSQSGYVIKDEVACLPSDFYEKFKNYQLHRFDVLLVMVGASVGDMGFVTSHILPALQNQNMWNFKARDLKNQIFVKFLVERVVKENAGSASGSARDFFRKDFFRTIKFACPNSLILERFNEVVSPMFEIIDKNQREIEDLTQIRDSLLPRLMSGKIRVN